MNLEDKITELEDELKSAKKSLESALEEVEYQSKKHRLQDEFVKEVEQSAGMKLESFSVWLRSNIIQAIHDINSTTVVEWPERK